MKTKLLILGAAGLLSIGGLVAYNLIRSEGTCSGGANCTACSSCKYCQHCSKDGGTCSVCK